jgi:hypothetical protein
VSGHVRPSTSVAAGSRGGEGVCAAEHTCG